MPEKMLRRAATVSTHSRPKAAGVPGSYVFYRDEVSTRSHAKAAGRLKLLQAHLFPAFQLTAARRRLDMACGIDKAEREFQLTAARRRLEISPACTSPSVVFQLTAARRRLGIRPATSRPCRCFNSQPPEGGWPAQMPEVFFQIIVSTHSRPKAAGKALREHNRHGLVSTHSRPKAAGI